MGLIRNPVARLVREMQIGPNPRVTKCNRLPPSAVRINIRVFAFSLSRSQRLERLVPFSILALEVVENRICHIAKALRYIPMCKRALPDNLATETCWTENTVEQNFQIMARGRIAVQIERP